MFLAINLFFLEIDLKVYDPITFGFIHWKDSSIEMEFLVSDESPIFLITPVKFYLQQLLFVKVTSENVA